MTSNSLLAYEGKNKKYNYTYGNDRGWVIPKSDDSGGTKGTWNTSGNWPNADGIADPNPNRDYFTIYTSRTISIPQSSPESAAVAFPGRTLRIGGELLAGASANNWNNLGSNVIMLGGSQLFFNSVGSITGERLALEDCDAEYPVYAVFSGRSDSLGHSYPKIFKPSVVSDSSAEFDWSTDTSSGAYGCRIEFGSSWPEFRGTVRFGSSVNTYAAPTFSVPGRVIVDSGATFELTAASGDSSFGGLKVCKGSTLKFASVGNTQTVSVADRLELEAGSIVDFNKFGRWENGTPPVYPVFVLSKTASEAGLPDMDDVAFPLSKCSNRKAGLPRLKWISEPLEDGGVKMCATYREIVTITNGMLKAKTPFYPDQNPDGSGHGSHYLSDGLNFHGGVDYFAQEKNVIAYAKSFPYEFPGESLVLSGGMFAIYGEFYCKDFVLCDNGRFRKMDSGPFRLTGAVKFVKTSGSCAWRFGCGHSCSYDVCADMSGDGDVLVCLYPESADKAVCYRGSCEFRGNNSAYSGRLTAYAGKEGDFGTSGAFNAAPYVPSAVSNVTIVAHGGTSLGGACGSFTFNAVTISNQCRLALAENAVFSESTRGWHFAGTSYLSVTNGISATARNAVTVGGTLVKEGAGTFMADRIVAESGSSASVEVREGAIGAVSAEAFDGVALAFAQGAKLAVQAKPADGVLASKGFVHSASGSVLALPADGIRVMVDYAGVDIAGAEPVSVGVMTVAEGVAENVRGKLFVGNRPSGYACEFVCMPNGDGTVTVALDMTKKGLKVIVR